MANASTRKAPPVVQPNVSSILVNPVQRGNALLGHIKHVAYQFAEIVPDYQMGTSTCALFLSLKYHRLHPEYIHSRIEKLQGMYNLRILLMMCDVTEHQDSIRELTRVCLINNITIMVAWSLEEAGVYLSTYKLFEHKPPDLIKERTEKDYTSILRAALTSVKGVNKTDVTTLRSTFGSVSGIAHATPEQLLNCPGFGQLKVRRLKDAIDKPFRSSATSEKRIQDEVSAKDGRREPSPAWPDWEDDATL